MDSISKVVEKVVDGVIVTVVFVLLFGTIYKFTTPDEEIYCSKNGIEYLIHRNKMAPNLSEFGLPKKCEVKKDG